MQAYTQHYRGKRANQSEPIAGRKHEMTSTSDGAYAFKVDDWQRLRRFLILGADGPTYYASARKMARSNAGVVERCIAEDGRKVVGQIAAVSDAGRAPNNDPALFALAMCVALGDDKTRTAAYSALPKVARIGTHLFHFVEYAEGLGKGWGRGMRKAVVAWYGDKDTGKLAYQLVKYKQRDGWSHRDLLRLSHPKADGARNDLYRWVVKGELGDKLPELVYAVTDIASADEKRATELIRQHNLPRECVPTEMLRSKKVWQALLEQMPYTAMMRNLGKMSQVGLLESMSEPTKLVCGRLADRDRLRKARVHPISVLKALKTYSAGKGFRGTNTWGVVGAVVDALDDAFYASFDNVVPTGKNTGIYLDISGSMSGGIWCGNTNLDMAGMTPRELSAAMAMVVARTEPNYAVFGFSHCLIELSITARQRLDDVVRTVSDLPFGYTDVSLPMVHAMQSGLDVDAFILYTDNETNSMASPHPSVALQDYRRKRGKDAKSVINAMVSNDISVADPKDPGMLDVVGFDTSAPQVIADFVRGDV